MTQAPGRLGDAARRDLLLIAALAAILVLPGLGRRDLWNPDEPRYAQVTREMRHHGDYLVPRYNDRLYAQKPPLMFWSIAASATLLGELDEAAVRLPSALAAIGSVCLLYSLGRRLFDRRAAWIATAVFLTNAKILWQARTGQIDMLLTFLVLAAMFFWVRGQLEQRPAFSYLFFALAGLATLAKGPVGLLPPLLSILAFLLLERDRRGLTDLRLGRGLLLWAGVVLLWLAPAIASAGREYMHQMLVGQNLTRYVAPEDHLRPAWYFLTTIPVDFLPWTVFLPAAVAGVRRLGEDERRWLRMLACWVGVTVVFFSLSPGKRTVYVLTMFPALSLVAGAGLSAWQRTEPGRARGWLAWPAGGLAAGVSVLALTLPAAADWPEVPSFAAPHAVRFALVFALVAAGATAATALVVRARSILAPIGALAVGLGAAGLVLFTSVLPRLDSEMSLRRLAGTIAREKPPGFELAALREMEGGLLFYGSGYARELEDEEEVRSYIEGRDVWLVVDPDGTIWSDLPPDLDLVASQGEREDAVRVYAIARGQPGEGGAPRPADGAPR